MSDDIILITGASSDIGRGLIRELMASRGDAAGFHGTMIAHAFSGSNKLELLKSEIPALVESLEIVKADLSSEAELSSMIETIRTRHGFPNRIVHLAAAKLKLKRAGEFEWNALTSDLEIQVRSITAILKAFLPSMSKSGRRCKVVFMLSSATLGSPPKHMMEYVVAKYALLGLLRSLAIEYADKAICFNGISPSMVDTQFLSNVPEKYIAMAAAAHPAKKNARVADVVPAIRFLLSPESDYISGANLPITAASVI
jgi:3-oxoacyl-[acyl-carrier protein] reductase